MTLEPVGDGLTPISYDEAEELIPEWVETRGQLNEVEAAAIAMALVALPAPLDLETMLAVDWLLALHRAMFSGVWRWAGSLRRVDLTIGQDWHRLPALLRLAVDDARFWFDAMEVDEAALRLHHRLVWIHPFRNGNGRWSRIVADLAAEAGGRPGFSWGEGIDPAERRPRYVAALRRADRESAVDALVAFARS